MSLTLNGSIASDERELIVAGMVRASIVPGYRFRLDDEMLRLRNFGQTRTGNLELPDHNRWRVERAVAGSTAASHETGADVLGVVDAWASGEDDAAPGPFDGGGSLDGIGVTADQKAALDAANAPDGANAFATMADLPAPGGSVGSFAPTAVELSQGSGVMTGFVGLGARACQVGPLVFVRFSILSGVGSAGEAGQPIYVSFPDLPAPSNAVSHSLVGEGWLLTFGNAGALHVVTGSPLTLAFVGSDAVAYGVVSGTLGDYSAAEGSFWYEAAP